MDGATLIFGMTMPRGHLFPLSRVKALWLEAIFPYFSEAPWQKVDDKSLDP